MATTTIRIAIAFVAITYVGALVLQPFFADRWFGISGALGASDSPAALVIALAFLASGGAVTAAGGRYRVGVIAFLSGAAWAFWYLAGRPGASETVRLAGVAVEPLQPVLLAVLVVAATADRPVRRMVRIGMLMLVSATITIAVVRVASYAPFFDPACRSACSDASNLWDIGLGARTAIRLMVTLLGVASSAFAIAWVLDRLVTRYPHVRQRAVVAGGGLVGWALALDALDRFLDPGTVQPWTRLFLVLAVLIFASALVVETVGIVQTRARLRRLADEIAAAPPPGTLATALSSALGDSVRIGYWLPEEGRYIDDNGRPFATDGDDAVGVTTAIERSGDPIAIVLHSAGADVASLWRHGGSSLLLALDNERLSAANRAYLVELRASRSRIVEAADRERRQIERDLHDGAQEGLLAVMFGLRMASAAAGRRGDLDRERRLRQLEARASSAVDGLRRLARGFHPAVLTQAGLGPALASLAEESAIPLEVNVNLPTDVVSACGEATYRVVVEALADARNRGASYVAVRVEADGNDLLTETEDDGSRATQPPVRVTDRVGAAGGTVTGGPRPDGNGCVMRVVMPCA